MSRLTVSLESECARMRAGDETLTGVERAAARACAAGAAAVAEALKVNNDD